MQPSPEEYQELGLELAWRLDRLVQAQEQRVEDDSQAIQQEMVKPLGEAMSLDDDDLAETSVYCLTPMSRSWQATILSALAESDERTARIVALATEVGDDEFSITPGDVPNLFPRFDLRALLSGNRTPPATSPPTPVTDLAATVHGTWAKRTPHHGEWWEPRGTFFSNLDSALRARGKPGLWSNVADYFSWTGSNSDRARKQAADDLIKWVGSRLNSGGTLTLFCHSHGGNVALVAAAKGLRIDRLFLMGTPIRTDYVLRLANIGKIVNFYSPTDHAQSSGSAGRRRGEGRTLSDTPAILNVCTVSPNTGHSSLHDWPVWRANGLDALV
jgi:hypothetical protein